MSLMRCDNCGRIVDTDDDPEAMRDMSTYHGGVQEYDWLCLCKPCREESDDDE